jgi:FolB domain-containing protein
MATDQIHIKDLLLRTIIGVNEDERRNKQDVLINITLYTDHAAAASDNIRDTVNYRTIAKQTVDLVEKSQFFLVEKMALEIVDICLADPRVERVIVTVEKPGAVRFARSVGVTVDRSRA